MADPDPPRKKRAPRKTKGDTFIFCEDPKTHEIAVRCLNPECEEIVPPRLWLLHRCRKPAGPGADGGGLLPGGGEPSPGGTR